MYVKSVLSLSISQLMFRVSQMKRLQCLGVSQKDPSQQTNVPNPAVGAHFDGAHNVYHS